MDLVNLNLGSLADSFNKLLLRSPNLLRKLSTILRDIKISLQMCPIASPRKGDANGGCGGKEAKPPAPPTASQRK